MPQERASPPTQWFKIVKVSSSPILPVYQGLARGSDIFSSWGQADGLATVLAIARSCGRKKKNSLTLAIECCSDICVTSAHD